MASFNKIIIVGYLGRDPELRYTPQGVAVCNFSVATTEKRKNSYGETEQLTTWFSVKAWRKTAEIVHQYLHKGSQAYIEGRLTQEEYIDREGNKRTSLVVNASEVNFLDLRGHGEETQQREERSSTPAKSEAREGSKQEPEDDEIPF